MTRIHNQEKQAHKRPYKQNLTNTHSGKKKEKRNQHLQKSYATREPQKTENIKVVKTGRIELDKLLHIKIKF